MAASSYLYFLPGGFLGMPEGLWIWVDECKGWGHVRLLLEVSGWLLVKGLVGLWERLWTPFPFPVPPTLGQPDFVPLQPSSAAPLTLGGALLPLPRSAVRYSFT